MKISKIIPLLLTPVLATGALGFLGMVLGSLYGGNFGCFAYHGLSGYESCGLFFGQLGLVVGAVVGVVLSVRHYKRLRSTLHTSV